MRTILLVVVGFVTAYLNNAVAMEFTAVANNAPPLELSYSVYGTGNIADGDSERFRETVQSFKASAAVTVYLSSPGGSVNAGLELGKLIQEFGYATSVARRNELTLTNSPAVCASACVLSYLGGAYRYLPDASELGVHQFSMSNPSALTSENALAAGQVTASEIVSFIKSSRADTELFTIMTSTVPTEIYFIPKAKLEDLRVVTNHIFDESWTYVVVQGVTFLRIWQQSLYGENDLMIGCNLGKIVAVYFVERTPELITELRNYSVAYIVNGEMKSIPASAILSQPEISGNYFAVRFLISPAISDELLSAKTVGVAVQPADKSIYFGFESQTKLGLGMLRNIVSGCK